MWMYVVWLWIALAISYGVYIVLGGSFAIGLLNTTLMCG